MSPDRVTGTGPSGDPGDPGDPPDEGATGTEDVSTAAAGTSDPPPDGDPVLPPPPSTLRGIAWRVFASTIGSCLRYRVTGLAAEAAFFAILSLPPLIFGLAGSVGYLADRYEVTEVDQFRDQIIEFSSRALTDSSVNKIVKPTLDDVLEGGRVDVISIGFVLALWSGSRALNVFVDTITIMYGLGGRRGIVPTRALSFTLYVIALVLGIIVVPLVLAGPALVSELISDQFAWLERLYWPTVLVLTVAFLTTVYHLSVPVRTSWRYDIPGAVLTLAVWIGGSWLLRATLQSTVGGGGTSIYGPLAAPIVVLLWLYILSIAVLIGAALNASFDRVFPEKSTARARLELVRRLRDKAMAARMREAGLDERGLTVLTGQAGPTGQEAESQLADHHHRVTLDEKARREGRQRPDRRRGADPGADPGAEPGVDEGADPGADTGVGRRDGSKDPPPVGPDDDTELLERPPQTR